MIHNFKTKANKKMILFINRLLFLFNSLSFNQISIWFMTLRAITESKTDVQMYDKCYEKVIWKMYQKLNPIVL